jgi:hypothetical protein
MKEALKFGNLFNQGFAKELTIRGAYRSDDVNPRLRSGAPSMADMKYAHRRLWSLSCFVDPLLWNVSRRTPAIPRKQTQTKKRRMSEKCRYRCKSRKSNDAENLANVDFLPTPPL